MPDAPPPLPPPQWTPEQADFTEGNARAVVFRMGAVMGGVVLLALALLGAQWFASQSSDEDFEDLLRQEELREDEGETILSGGGLASEAAVLDVSSTLPGSSVFVDGDSAGVTPLRLDLDRPGESWVLVTNAGRTLLDTTLRVGPGEVALLTASAPEPAALPAEPPPSEEPAAVVQSGAIRVTSAPSGAEVLLNGRRVGETPIAVEGLATGRYSLAVRRSGYEAVARSITIRPGTRYETDIALRSAAPPPAAPPVAAPPRPAPPRPAPEPAAAPEPALGTLEVLVRPWGRIEINGQVRQRESDVVYRTELPVGRHRIRVSHPVLGAQEREVLVDRGATLRVDINLDSDG